MVMIIILIMMIVTSDDGEDGRERGKEKTVMSMVLTIYFKSTSLEKCQDNERKQQQKEQHQSHVFDTHTKNINLSVPQFFVQSLSHILLFVTPWAVALPGFPIHGISQARILEWIVISISRGSSLTRDQTHISCIGGRFFTTEPPGKPSTVLSNIFNQL